MHDVNHALGILRQKLKLPKLELNGKGQAEIDFGDGFSVFVTQIEPTIAELSFRLPELKAPDAAMMRAMLEANSLGTGVGAGRLAIDGARNETIYCERWSVTELDGPAVEARFTAFLRYGTFWRSEGTDLLIEESGKASAAVSSVSDESHDAGLMIRI